MQPASPRSSVGQSGALVKRRSSVRFRSRAPRSTSSGRPSGRASRPALSITWSMSHAFGMARGHVSRRPNGTWRVLVYAGRDPVTKKPIYLTATGKTEAEAERLRTKLLHQVDEQRTPNTGTTVGHLLDRFFEVADLEMTTRLTYEGYTRRNIRPALGDLPLRKLTVDVLDRFYAQMRKHGGEPCERGRSPAR